MDAPVKGTPRVHTIEHSDECLEFALETVEQGSTALTHVRGVASGALLAVFTQDAHTVTLSGPLRIFSAPDCPHNVGHRTWVRALPKPFDGKLDATWLLAALGANAAGAPDILALAMQYLHDAPEVERGGLRIAGTARYGPCVNGKREGSDFNDYLGVKWHYPDEKLNDDPESSQACSLDCSGYMRMIWCYRAHLPTGMGLPMCHKPRKDKSALPRRANEMFRCGPGVAVVPRGRKQVTQFDALRIGDLVFFDADRSKKDASRLDHVGMFLGVDSAGHHRFVSSRQTHDGPTFGDEGGPSVLDGERLYARSFRAVRRL